MRKMIAEKFEEIWTKAEKRNAELGAVTGFDDATGQRFVRIYDQGKRYITMGIYDTVSKKYCVFDTINLVGNFRYSPREVPPELVEMERMVSS